MCCDTRNTTIAEQRLREEALKDLERLIATGRVNVVRDFSGKLSIPMWQNTPTARAGWMEGCALEKVDFKKIANDPRTSWLVKSKLQALGVNATTVKTAAGCHHK